MKNGQAQESGSTQRRPVQCPKCSSYSASVIDISPPYARCRCADCGTIYNYRMREVINGDDNGSAHEDGEDGDSTSRRRKAKADSRAQIKPAPRPELGFNTVVLDEVIAAGPAGLRKAQHTALRHAKRHLEEAADSWKLETEWLKSFDAVHRVCARYALVWRPRFLAALSMCHSPELAARYTRISCQMAYYHRKNDPQFAEQWDEAREYAIGMLHARAFQRALEGDCEPIMYLGVPVAYVRKFDSKLQIEMLRAYRPDRFKTPGTNVNIGTKGDVFVLTEEQRHRLIEVNREFLLTTPHPNMSQNETLEPQRLTNGETQEPTP